MKKQTFQSAYKAWKAAYAPQKHIDALLKSPALSPDTRAILRVEWTRLQAISQPLREAALSLSQTKEQFEAEQSNLT